MSNRLLLLEDDALLAATMIDALSEAGFVVTHVNHGEAVLDATFEQKFDLYLLDVNVPRVGGFELLKALRDAGDTTPAFFITALSDLASLKQGFDVGGDDYIKKPFDMEELLVRIQSKMVKQSHPITVGALVYDPVRDTLTYETHPVDLGQVTHDILVLLLTHAGQIVDKTAFFEVMSEPTDAALRVHITKLKQRFNLPLTNVRGIGYRLETA